jgi:hypothetical protein
MVIDLETLILCLIQHLTKTTNIPHRFTLRSTPLGYDHVLFL